MILEVAAELRVLATGQDVAATALDAAAAVPTATEAVQEVAEDGPAIKAEVGGKEEEERESRPEVTTASVKTEETTTDSGSVDIKA